MNILVNSPDDAKYKIYQRTGRHDKISLVELSKLEPIKLFEWEKI
jgi:hypothetical protein